MHNRVEGEQEALWSRHDKNLARDPDLQNRRGYWKEMAKQADAIIDKYKNDKKLTPAEKSSLAIAKLSRDRFKDKSQPKYLQRAGRFTLKTFTGFGKGVAGALQRGANGSFKETLARAPWFFALLGHGVRAAVNLTAKAISVTMKVADFFTDWLLPAVPPLKAGNGNRRPENGERPAQQRQKNNEPQQEKSQQQSQSNQQEQTNVQAQSNGASKWKKDNDKGHAKFQPKDNPLSVGPKDTSPSKDTPRQSTSPSLPGPSPLGQAPLTGVDNKVRAPGDRLVPPPEHRRVLQDTPGKGLGPSR